MTCRGLHDGLRDRDRDRWEREESRGFGCPGGRWDHSPNQRLAGEAKPFKILSAMNFPPVIPLSLSGLVSERGFADNAVMDRAAPAP